jgi:hypothetical protein
MYVLNLILSYIYQEVVTFDHEHLIFLSTLVPTVYIAVNLRVLHEAKNMCGRCLGRGC